jgi:hypothetical protein
MLIREEKKNLKWGRNKRFYMLRKTKLNRGANWRNLTYYFNSKHKMMLPDRTKRSTRIRCSETNSTETGFQSSTTISKSKTSCTSKTSPTLILNSSPSILNQSATQCKTRCSWTKTKTRNESKLSEMLNRLSNNKLKTSYGWKT